jgi:glutathione peroxidase
VRGSLLACGIGTLCATRLSPTTLRSDEVNHARRSQTSSRIARGLFRDTSARSSPRHDPHHRLRLSFPALAGGEIRLAAHTGKPILVVNTASLCGFTPQYAGLQQLWERYHGRGLMIIGVPSNDFGGQEPGGAADIVKTAHGEYGIGFPLAAKAQVKGSSPHPFYKWAAGERPLETPRWNFHKYLVGRDGHIAAVFATDIEPMDARVINAIAKELPRPE